MFDTNLFSPTSLSSNCLENLVMGIDQTLSKSSCLVFSVGVLDRSYSEKFHTLWCKPRLVDVLTPLPHLVKSVSAITAKTTGQVQLKARAVYCAVECSLGALIRHVRLQNCDESLTGARQWWAAKLHIHWPDRTGTLYTLRVFGENSIHIGANRLLLMPWVSVQNAQA